MCQSSWSTPATTTVYGTVQSAGIISGVTATLTAPGGMESTAEYIFIYDKALATSTTSHGSSSSTSSTSTSTPLLPPGHKGLSGGAIAGICVGVLALVAALGVIAFWRRRKTAAKEPDDVGQGKAELSGEPKKLAELPGGSGYEVGELQDGSWHRGNPAELYVQPAELEALDNAARDK